MGTNGRKGRGELGEEKGAGGGATVEDEAEEVGEKAMQIYRELDDAFNSLDRQE